jgi:hypothetical protein
MDVSEVNILDVVGGVVVSDLSSCPVETFNFDNFVVGNLAAGRDY